MSRLGAVMRRAVWVLVGAAALVPAACRKPEPRPLDSVRALRNRVRPAFRPPGDGIVTDAQLDMYVKVSRSAVGRSGSERAETLGVDPQEYAWVRGRIIEALGALDAKQVADAAVDSYASGIEDLREARRSTQEPRAIARIDAEIATLERERSSLRRKDMRAAATLKNASRVAARRAEIESPQP